MLASSLCSRHYHRTWAHCAAQHALCVRTHDHTLVRSTYARNNVTQSSLSPFALSRFIVMLFCTCLTVFVFALSLCSNWFFCTLSLLLSFSMATLLQFPIKRFQLLIRRCITLLNGREGERQIPKQRWGSDSDATRGVTACRQRRVFASNCVCVCVYKHFWGPRSLSLSLSLITPIHVCRSLLCSLSLLHTRIALRLSHIIFVC